jgi:protein ImuB
MLWLALEFPRLALESVQIEDHDTPRVIYAQTGARRSVIDLNTAAARHGIRVGLPVAAAQALCGALRAQARQPEREAETLRTRATWALRYTPWVVLRHERVLLLEIATSLRLFGGLRALLARARSELAGLRWCYRAAVAPTPAAAVLLARAGPTRAVTSTRRLRAVLQAMELECSELPEDVVHALHGVGVRRLGQLLGLPRAEIARRFGQACVNYLDRLLGRAHEALPRFDLPACFDAALELPAPVQHSEALGFAAQRLLRAFCHWLEAAQRAVLDYRLHVRHEDHPDSVLEFGLRQPCIDHTHLSQLLRARLSELALPAAAQSLRLLGGACVPLAAPNGDLFQRAAQTDDDAGRLLERLRGRLGDIAIRQPVLHADHRPEFAQSNRGVHDPALIERAALRPRPLYLFDPPQDLARWPLADFDAPGTALAERIESGWWDEHSVRRDYFRVPCADGALCWLFRDRGNGECYVHGLFA